MIAPGSCRHLSIDDLRVAQQAVGCAVRLAEVHDAVKQYDDDRSVKGPFLLASVVARRQK